MKGWWRRIVAAVCFLKNQRKCGHAGALPYERLLGYKSSFCTAQLFCDSFESEARKRRSYVKFAIYRM